MELGLTELIAIGLTIIIVVSMLIIGLVCRLKQRGPKTQGVVYVYYYDNNDKPSLFLEADVPVEEIVRRKRVTFDVIVTR